MARSNIHVGLEIGSTKTVMVVAEIKPDESAKILGMGETRTAGVRKGEIADYKQVRACVKSALLEAEDVSDVVIKSVFLQSLVPISKASITRGLSVFPKMSRKSIDTTLRRLRKLPAILRFLASTSTFTILPGTLL